LTADGSIRAGGLNEDGGDDCGSLEFEYSETERDSLGSLDVDAGDGSEMVVWSPVCSLRRKVEVGR
jgi:hypothetical protein